MTGEDGTYCVEVVPGSCIIPKPDPEDCPECDTAISEHDCALIPKIRALILGQQSNLSSAQILAADVNCDGSINMIDVMIMQIYCNDSDSPWLDQNDCIGNCKYIPASQVPWGIGDAWPPLAEEECGEMDFVMVFSGDLNGNCSSCEIEVVPGPTIEKFMIESEDGQTHITCNSDLILSDFLIIYERSQDDSRVTYNPDILNVALIEETDFGPYRAVAFSIPESFSIESGVTLISLPEEALILGDFYVNHQAASILEVSLDARARDDHSVAQLSVFTDIENVYAQLDGEFIKEYKILDMEGMQIVHREMTAEQNSIIESTAHYRPGLYILQLVTVQGQVISERFVHVR